jgi:histone-lysine N-methyltransferase SETDB2
VIDVTKHREETAPGDRCKQATIWDNENIKKDFEIQIKKPQEEKSPACQNQQVFCDEELTSETNNTSSDSLRKFNKGNIFLLDATKEGNVGRFLNVSIKTGICISQQLFSCGSFKNLGEDRINIF